MDLRLYESIIEYATDAVLITKSERRGVRAIPVIMYVNDAYVNMTGYTKEEAIGKSPKILQGPETDRNELAKLRNAIESGRSGHAELINYKKNGEKFWTSISIYPVRTDSSDSEHWVGIKRDITTQRTAFEETRAALYELHHRVKNNLAIVSAMLELQALEEKSEPVRSKLLISTTRIKAIADIHEMLYVNDQITHIDMQDCIQSLVNRVTDMLQTDKKIEFRFKGSGIPVLNINQAIPCTLIVNEVIINAVKHAFKNKTHGKININLSQKNDNITFKIQDDGVGMPRRFKHTESRTTGMLLIKTISDQLHARYRFSDRNPGTEFKLDFIKRAQLKGSHSSLDL